LDKGRREGGGGKGAKGNIELNFYIKVRIKMPEKNLKE
jgi:hypothetical protein